jgi:hypothetical protein
LGGREGLYQAYSKQKIDRDALARDVDSEDDSEWLDDPVALGLQPLNDAARHVTIAGGHHRPQLTPQQQELASKSA